jgi:hypothetical protein
VECGHLEDKGGDEKITIGCILGMRRPCSGLFLKVSYIFTKLPMSKS